MTVGPSGLVGLTVLRDVQVHLTHWYKHSHRENRDLHIPLPLT